MKTYKVKFNANEVEVDKNNLHNAKYRALEKDYHKTTDKITEFIFSAKDFIDAMDISKDWYFKQYNEQPKSVEVKLN